MNDVMRVKSRDLSDVDKGKINDVKLVGNHLHELLLESGGDGRCMALARTKLEECVMWAVKGLSA